MLWIQSNLVTCYCRTFPSQMLQHDLAFMRIYAQRTQVPGAIIIDGMQLYPSAYNLQVCNFVCRIPNHLDLRMAVKIPSPDPPTLQRSAFFFFFFFVTGMTMSQFFILQVFGILSVVSAISKNGLYSGKFTPFYLTLLNNNHFVYLFFKGGSGYCKFGWSKYAAPSGRSATFLVRYIFNLNVLVLSKEVPNCQNIHVKFNIGYSLIPFLEIT